MRRFPLYVLILALCAGQTCIPDGSNQQMDGGTTGGTDTTGATGGGSTDGGGTTNGGGGTNTTFGPPTTALIVDYQAANAFGSIPAAYISAASSHYRIFYGHTSHGSQIVTGMGMIHAQDNRFAYNAGAGSLSLTENDGVDLGHEGDTSWADITRSALTSGNYNMVMWSWCGGVSDNTEAGINTYLNTMNQLESQYPGVVFVYMTGHLDGTGPGGNLEVRNNQIRQYCQANNKVLFDFASIESHDLSGNYQNTGTDYCEWCESWCSSHTCPPCDDCAHSVCYNCYRKGQAFWWMMARLSGWSGT